MALQTVQIKRHAQTRNHTLHRAARPTIYATLLAHFPESFSRFCSVVSTFYIALVSHGLLFRLQGICNSVNYNQLAVCELHSSSLYVQFHGQAYEIVYYAKENGVLKNESYVIPQI